MQYAKVTIEKGGNMKKTIKMMYFCQCCNTSVPFEALAARIEAAGNANYYYCEDCFIRIKDDITDQVIFEDARFIIYKRQAA